MIKLGNVVLKGAIGYTHIIRSNGLERSQLDGYTMIKLGQMVLKGVNWVHNDKISLNGIERSQLGIQCKNQVIWS